MDRNAYLTRLAELLDVDCVSISDRLRDFDTWDSLTVLSVISFADEEFGCVINKNDLDKLETAGELYNFMESSGLSGEENEDNLL